MELAATHAIFTTFAAANPHPQTELNYTNAYTLLVAVALSAQSTDIGVNKATKALFTQVDTPQKMLALGEDGFIAHIKTIGLYKTKAKNVLAAARILVDEFGGEVPNRRADLEKLPGVGRKTANVVLNIAFGEPTLAVDTHIFRVSNRMGLAAGKTPYDIEMGLEAAIPAEFKQHAHHWLILHGRYTCTARSPKCGDCSVRQWCEFEGKTA